MALEVEALSPEGFLEGSQAKVSPEVSLESFQTKVSPVEGSQAEGSQAMISPVESSQAVGSPEAALAALTALRLEAVPERAHVVATQEAARP